MEPFDGCRLCLDPFSDNASSLESEDLQKQMQQVFSFTVGAEIKLDKLN